MKDKLEQPENNFAEFASLLHVGFESHEMRQLKCALTGKKFRHFISDV